MKSQCLMYNLIFCSIFTSCQINKGGPTGSDLMARDNTVGIDAKAIYKALVIDETESESRGLPEEVPSFFKKVGRLNCTKKFLPEEVYFCELGSTRLSDKGIFDALKNVPAEPSTLPGSAEWTKRVGGLTCSMTTNVSPDGVYLCQLRGGQPTPSESEPNTNELLRLKDSKEIYSALKEVREVKVVRGLPGETPTFEKKVGRLSCNMAHVPEQVYSCTYDTKASGSDKPIYQALNVVAVPSKLPGTTETTKEVGGLICTLSFDAIPEGACQCRAK